MRRWIHQRRQRRYAAGCIRRASQLHPGQSAEVWANDWLYGGEDGAYPATVVAVGADIPPATGELDVRRYEGCPSVGGLVELEIPDPAGYGRGFTCGPDILGGGVAVFLGTHADSSRVIVPATLVRPPGSVQTVWVDSGLRIGSAA